MRTSWRIGLAVCLLLPAAGPVRAQRPPGGIEGGNHQPGAFELLEKVRQTYAGLSSYQDSGEIVETRRVDGVEQETLSWFETAVSEDGFRWDLRQSAAQDFRHRVIWSEGEVAFTYDSLLKQYRHVAWIGAEIVQGFGDGGFEALVVPILLAGNAAALDDPEAAAVEGVESCGDGSCWLLVLSRMSGSISTCLWIDRDSLLIRRVEVELMPLSVAAPVAGTTIRVDHHIAAPDEPPSPLAAARIPFLLPPDARQVEQWEPLAEPAAVAGQELDDEIFYDEITVALFTVVARIVDHHGNPVLGLGPEDLVVRAGKTELRVTAVDWVPSDGGPAVAYGPTAASEGSETLAGGRISENRPEIRQEPPGKLVVLFIQAEIEPTVVKGHLKALPYVRELVAGLGADDRVAVVTYFRHLELWRDFTRDREAINESLSRAVRPGARPGTDPGAAVREAFPNRADRGPSLRRHFDFQAAQRATSPERSLQLVGEALAPLAGEKVVIYIGWYVGSYKAGAGVAMNEHYLPALRALDAARATVFVLDVTEADWHTLEIGLENVARSTGGTYAKTFHFPSQAIRQLVRTITGHYVLTIDRAGATSSRGPLNVRLRQKKGRVLYKPVVLN